MKLVFRSLRTRNYRLFFTGQLVSLAGTWMQTVAQDWLILKLTSSGVAVGLSTALQFGPMLLAGMWGGVIADRFHKRRVLMVTQSLFLAQALVLGTLVATGSIRVWMVYALAAAFGAVQVVDVPARQSFVAEMVPREDVMNAVGLNSAIFNSGRIVGPALAGVVIGTAGIAVCFFVNAASYVAVIAGLWRMRDDELHLHAGEAERPRKQVREALRYVLGKRELLMPIALVAVVGMFGLNFRIVLPLLARFTFHRGATVFGTLSSVMATGSLCGAVFAASRKRPSRRLLVGTACAFGGLETAAAFVPGLGSAYAVLPFVGFASMLFLSTCNSMLQLSSSPRMRGRVLALYSLVFLGGNPIGAPIVGWISQTWTPRAALGVGGAVSLAAGCVAGVVLRGHRREERAALEPQPAMV